MTLKELLKDKQLPLRVRLQEWDKKFGIGMKTRYQIVVLRETI